MAIEIYNTGGALLQSIPKALSASLCEKLDGTQTFDFIALQKRALPIQPGMVAKHRGQYYNIVRVKRGFSSGMETSSVSCEHVSYILNDAAYNLVTFVFEGTPAAGLSGLLSGTPFTVGIVEPSIPVECAFTEKSPLNRRSALLRFADAAGGELEYDGYAINICSHRGSAVRKTLMDGKNVTSLSATYDGRKDTQAYEINLFKLVELSVGDEVNITYRPLSINVNTRIVGLTYNPFDRYSVRVEVGDYMPNLLAANADRVEGLSQEFRAANGRLESKITSAEGAVSTLTQTVGGFDVRIANAEGAVSTLSKTVNGFDVRITGAEDSVASLSLSVNGFETRISGTEGNISSLSQSLSSITTRVSNAEGDISTVEQKANKIEWVVASGTSSSNFTLSSRVISLVSTGINISGYVTITALKTAGQTTIHGGNITTGSISADRISSGTLTSMVISNNEIKIDGSSITFLTANGAIKRGSSSSLQNVLSFTSQSMVIGAYSGPAVNTLSIPMQSITIGYSASYTTLTLSANTSNAGTLSCSGTATFHSNVSHASTASFTGTATFNGQATFATTCTHNGTTNLSTTSIGGVLTCSNTAVFSGSTRFTSAIGFYGATAVSKVAIATISTSSTLAVTIGKLNELITRLKTMGLV